MAAADEDISAAADSREPPNPEQLSTVTFHHQLSNRTFMSPFSSTSSLSDVQAACKGKGILVVCAYLCLKLIFSTRFAEHFNFFYEANLFEVPTARPSYKNSEFGVRISTHLTPIPDQAHWESGFAAWKKRADIARRGKKVEILHDLKGKFIEYEAGPILGDDVFGDDAALRRCYVEHGAKFQEALWQLYELLYPRQNIFLADDETIRYIMGLVVPLGNPDPQRGSRSNSLDSANNLAFGNRERAASAHSESSYTTMDAEGCAIGLRILWRLSESPSLCIRILALGGAQDKEGPTPCLVTCLLQLLSSLGGGPLESPVHFALDLNAFGLLHNILTVGLAVPRAVKYLQRYVPVSAFKRYAEALLSSLSRPKHALPEKQAAVADEEEYKSTMSCLAKAFNIILHNPRSEYRGGEESDYWYYECLRSVPEFLVEDRAGIKNRGIQMVIDLAKCEDNYTVCQTGLFVLLMVGTAETLNEHLTDEVLIDIFNAAVVVAERSMQTLLRDPFMSPESDDESSMYSLSEGRWSVKSKPHEYDVDAGELPALHLNVAIFMMWAFGRRLVAMTSFSKPLDDRWISTLLKAATFSYSNNDPRVRPAVAHGASGCLAVMASNDVIAANPKIVSGLLQLTTPHQPLVVRNNSCLALAHVANRHLINHRGRRGGGDTCETGSWIKFSQMVLISKAAHLLYGCAESKYEMFASRVTKDDIEMRENASSALMAMCIAATSADGMEKIKKDGLTRPSYLLACTTSHTVVRSAAVMVWSLARQSTAIQEMLGGNGTVERLLAVLTRLESELTASENGEMSADDALLLVSTMSWAATALWVLCEFEQNGNVVASSHSGILVLCRLVEACFSAPPTSAVASRASSARPSPRRKRQRNHRAALGVACLGTLRCCISTTYGQHMMHEKHTGFTLTTCLLSVLRANSPRPTAPALREAGGLLFKVQTSPYMRRIAEQVHGSSTVLEDTFGGLLEADASSTPGPNFAELIGDIAIVCGSLAMRTQSNKYLVETGALGRLFKFLDPLVDLGPFHHGAYMSTSTSSRMRMGSSSIGEVSAENIDAADEYLGEGPNSGSQGTMRLCILQAVLNFSASPVSHREIARCGVDFIVDVSETAPEFIRSLACKVLLNLSRSEDLKVRATLYKAQLKVASSAVGRIDAKTREDERARPATTGSTSRRAPRSTEVAKTLVETSPTLKSLFDNFDLEGQSRPDEWWASRSAKLEKPDRMSLQNQLRGSVGKAWKRTIDAGDSLDKLGWRPSTAAAVAAAATKSPFSARSQSMSEFLPLSPVVLGKNRKSPWKPPVVVQFQEDEAADAGKETLVMEPAAPFNQVSFSNARGSNLLDPESTRGVWRFRAVPGARVYEQMMHKLPSLAGGEHYYYYSSNIIPYEPSHIGSLLPPENPANLLTLGLEVPEPRMSRGLAGSSLPAPTPRGGLLPVDSPPINTLYLEGTRLACRLLNGKNVTFDAGCVGEPAIPDVAFPVQQEGEVNDDDMESESKWTVEESVFAPRKKESDAKDFYNTEQVWDTRFAKDWKRNAELERFKKLITNGNKEIKDGNTTPEAEMEEVQQHLRDQWVPLMSLYQWFVSMEGEMSEGGLNSLTIKSSQFKTFVNMVMKGKNNMSMVQALARIFLSVNLEESDGDKTHEKENDLNPSSSIMAHEWMETIVRFALTLHGKEKVRKKKRKDASFACLYSS